jgi:NADH-quinone oxidoreductase subunit N
MNQQIVNLPVFSTLDSKILQAPMLLVIAALLVLILSAYFKHDAKKAFYYSTVISVMGILGALWVVPSASTHEEFSCFYHLLKLSEWSVPLFILSCVGTCLAVIAVYLQEQALKFAPEVQALFLFALVGIYFIGLGEHLVFLFIVLEVLSLSTYVMVSSRRIPASAEAGMKYFIMGSLASCFLLYGSVLLFGATGSFQLTEIKHSLQAASDAKMQMALLGSGLIFSALMFKLGAVPFHTWVADVYQGSVASLTGWMSSVVKAASFMFFLKLAQGLFFLPGLFTYFSPLLWSVAIITILWGNIAAIGQFSLKRLLAFSSVAHTGYLLLAVLVSAYVPATTSSIIFYLIAYTFTTFGAFFVLAYWEATLKKEIYLQDFKDAILSGDNKLFRYSFTLAVLSMTGIPLTLGFVAKVSLLQNILATDHLHFVWPILVGSVISLYYYFRSIAYLNFPLVAGSEETLIVRSRNTEVYNFSCVVIYIMFGINIILGLFPALINYFFMN